MDYVLGGVAALITGNVTPNRPRLSKRALTPTKHQPSPNVTPKSEFVEDRSIFLSPSMQKKKAIVKKSPKRIFQNPDLETTENEEGNSTLASPLADKVKKHLKDDLEADSAVNKSLTPQKSPKKKSNSKNESVTQGSDKIVSEQKSNENTPKKKKRKHISESQSTENVAETQITETVGTQEAVSPKEGKKKRKSVSEAEGGNENITSESITEPQSSLADSKSPKKQKIINNSDNSDKDKETPVPANTTKKKNKRRKKKSKAGIEAAATVATAASEEKAAENESEETNKENIQTDNQGPTKKKNKRKKSKGKGNKPEIKAIEEKPAVEDDDNNNDGDTSDDDDLENQESSTVNPNAITDKESESEHESDDDIDSENEETNKKVFESEKPDESSEDEEEEKEKETVKEQKEVTKKEKPKKEEVNAEDEIKRTLFVGNVPFSAKCKKEIKKIFNKHGQIETIRIRTVPIKDGRFTPKLALIKNELHPERTTVNVYIKYADAESVEKALCENNSVLQEHHLRVSRSDVSGAAHDPRCAVFVGNLPFAMEDDALRAKFDKCGAIESVRIIRDKKTNAGKGFGYVNFESKDGVELALALTEEDLTVKNRILRVKRCTLGTDKKRPANNQQRGSQGNQDRPQRGGFKQGGGRVSQGNRQRAFGPPGNQQGGRFNSGDQGNQQRGRFNRADQGNQQRGRFNSEGNQQRGRFNAAGDQGNQRGGFKKFDNQRNQGQKDEEGREGAFRRIMQKRKNEGTGPSDGPPNKRPNINQPSKEKKVRKEFVGMTAEKKKKHKFDKGQKKKKALSEILTK
ncbi:nucleolar protein 12-like [Trichoplusia ni]|uniref:Nucleolar protein 12-like n=1 Tax=Trichoplusia ni TaxID=7111 RepID=A0A7E5VLF4_TRINI|nr:nucleolar protein 12-like [Trichoplusia ni]